MSLWRSVTSKLRWLSTAAFSTSSFEARALPAAFIDLGDQFIAFQKGRTQPADDGRHFGLVVDDKEAVRQALADAGVEALPGPFLDFLDPWGNRIEIVGYANVQFTKAPNVLRGMGLSHLSKNQAAIKELTDKGMAPRLNDLRPRGRLDMKSLGKKPEGARLERIKASPLWAGERFRNVHPVIPGLRDPNASMPTHQRVSLRR